MKPCPHCGVMLTASLVDAIKNPSREESCPKAPQATKTVAAQEQSGRLTLAALMLLGSTFPAVFR